MSAKSWQATLQHFGHVCVYCGRTDLPITIDHWVPRSLGGYSNIGNIVPACAPCNNAKGSIPPAKLDTKFPAERIAWINSMLEPLKALHAEYKKRGDNRRRAERAKRKKTREKAASVCNAI